MTESEDKLIAGLKQLDVAIGMCVDAKLIMPALALLYTSIDIAAWVRSGDQGNIASQFISWADRYLLPDSGLQCTAKELYSARCGLLHTYSSQSRLTKKNEARELVYAWGNSTAEDFQELIDLAQIDTFIPIKIEILFEAYRQGIKRMLDELQRDEQLASRAYERGSKFYVSMSRDERDSLLNWGKQQLGDGL